jgi:hypothetical protein
MNRPHDAPFDDKTPQERSARIEDYLDYLCAPLLGVVPYAERRSLREEARLHLLDMVAEFEAQGLPPQEALTSALRAHGNPWRIGQSFVQEWSQGTTEAPPRYWIRKATRCAFAWFGIASMLSILLIEQYTGEVNSHIVASKGYLMPVSYQDGLYPYLMALLVLSPLAAGYLTGITAPRQVLRGIVNALTLLTAHALVTACLLLPKIEGFAFSLLLVGYWLPIGCGTALATATLRRYYHCQRFWQLAR